MQWFTGHFLPEGEDPADPLRSPILSPRLKDSAPALIITAGFDPLQRRGRGLRARRSKQAGVDVLVHRFRGLFHGFINSVGASPSSYAALVETAGMTRAMLRAG